jgi:hypothetical protein
VQCDASIHVTENVVHNRTPRVGAGFEIFEPLRLFNFGQLALRFRCQG